METALRTAFGGPVDQKLSVGDGYVVLSPAHDGDRELAYLRGSGNAWSLAGQKMALRASGEVTALKQENGLLVVESLKEKAPQYTAFGMGPAGLEQADYYGAIAPEPAVKTGHFLLVNKRLNVLYHFLDGKLVKAYRVATGRQTEGPVPTMENYRTNFFTPEGRFTITNFVVNPSYHAMKPGDQSYVGGAPGNPLGTRWMGFSALPGDNAWVWGIHGTSHPEQIGTWASDGCIRMYTAQAEELFDQIRGALPALLVVGK